MVPNALRALAANPDADHTTAIAPTTPIPICWAVCTLSEVLTMVDRPGITLATASSTSCVALGSFLRTAPVIESITINRGGSERNAP